MKGDLLKRTISFMTGKGSLNHNSRKFHAKNTDPNRTHWNVEYCNEDIKDVYHELFDDALKRYNDKQTRKDRKIDDYYEKIRSGKQEKLFHEVILQIGDKDNMGSETMEGQLAAKILDEYMKGFQERNPTLRVFAAHLHLDEATPHLHIDFIPYVTGSKRGLDTRVSLKQALSSLGFKGGSRSETELNQWVQSEKEKLAMVMRENEIEWDQKGTHEPHLSVLDYKKKVREQEVEELTEHKNLLEHDLHDISECVDEIQKEKEQAEKKAVHLKMECEAFSMKMDPALMESLLINLIDNALKATDAGGSIWVKAYEKAGKKIFEVSDTGMGIPEEELGKITDAFYMVDKSRSRKEGGSGLGLALCVKVAEIHGGCLKIESRQREGTTVRAIF